MDIFYEWVGMGGGIFWVAEGVWTYFMGGWDIFQVGGDGWPFFMGGWG